MSATAASDQGVVECCPEEVMSEPRRRVQPAQHAAAGGRGMVVASRQPHRTKPLPPGFPLVPPRDPQGSSHDSRQPPTAKALTKRPHHPPVTNPTTRPTPTAATATAIKGTQKIKKKKKKKKKTTTVTTKEEETTERNSDSSKGRARASVGDTAARKAHVGVSVHPLHGGGAAAAAAATAAIEKSSPRKRKRGAAAVASAVLTPGARALVKLPHAADSSGGHPPEAKSAFDGTERSLPFETDSADHAETPTDAYFHIAPLLDLLAKACGKTRATLRIYDPFFCDGSVIEKLGALGFRHVINRCEDFYAAVAEKRLPPHDVLLTNPPYSADHMENILRFCSQQNGDTPWLVLMPNFVYTKNYYNDATSGTSPFYIAPLKRYYYYPPSWTAETAKSRHRHSGNWTSPFPSIWYCNAGSTLATKQLCRHPPKLPPNVYFAESTENLPDELRPELEPKKKRLNPKARKRAAKKRATAASAPSAPFRGSLESLAVSTNRQKKRRF